MLRNSVDLWKGPRCHPGKTIKSGSLRHSTNAINYINKCTQNVVCIKYLTRQYPLRSIKLDFLDAGALAAVPLGPATRGISRGQNGIQAVMAGFEQGEADADTQPEA